MILCRFLRAATLEMHTRVLAVLWVIMVSFYIYFFYLEFFHVKYS
jgi:hypothetical protein